MKHNIIKTENYLLVVDDSEIKNYYYDSYVKGIRRRNGAEYGENSIVKQIIAHLPLNDAPILEGVDLLPPLEDEVIKLAYASFDGCDGCDATDEMFYTNGYIKGYNKAKEKYKYPEEDLRNAYRHGTTVNHGTSEHFNHFIQSLQQTKYPIAFECEIEVGDYGDKNGLRKFVKTIINSQGLTQWVGKYIY